MGVDTLSGLKRKAQSIDVRTANSGNLSTLVQQSDPALVEYTLGGNGDPFGKIRTFRGLMSTVGNNVQIAFMKFCYADFEDTTLNVDNLIAAYQEAFTDLQGNFPRVLFVHVTVPLYHRLASYRNNRREQFSAWLRKTYGGQVFDLATIESIGPNNTTALSLDNVTIAMADAWTDDGGHLNLLGQDRMGSALVGFLASQPVVPPH